MPTSVDVASHRVTRVFVALLMLVLGLVAPPMAAAQVQFQQAVQDLASEDAAVRLRTLRALREAGYPEAAVPISALIIDAQDSIQLQAIAVELDIFLAERVMSRKDDGPTIEKRESLTAEAAFEAGPLVLGMRPVPSEVLNALRVAAHDDNKHVALEALYGFGTLASRQDGYSRLALQKVGASDLVELLDARDADLRLAAARVIGRLYAKRATDPPVDAVVGEGLVMTLNDKDGAVRKAATQALGDLRYEPSVPVLTEALKVHRKGDCAEAALDALARIASPASAPVFREELTSKSATCRATAVEGLARLKGVVKLGEIQTALAKERSDEVSLALAFAATMMADAPIDQLGESLVRARNRERARRYLIELAPGHPGRFTRHLMDPDARIRAEVAEILTLADDPGALALVMPLASDQDPVVAFAGGRAVARLQTGSARPAS